MGDALAPEDSPSVADSPSSADSRYLAASRVVDFSDPGITRLARELRASTSDDLELARLTFEWVRDNVSHSMDAQRDEVTCSASDVLRVGTGLCYAKSHLLVALLRANGLPAGFVYQRLTLDDGGDQYCLHGLAAVALGALQGVAPQGAALQERAPEWYRIDPRGNKPGVDAQFTPPIERLAFTPTAPGERDFPGVYAEPWPVVVEALRAFTSLRKLLPVLPDSKEPPGAPAVVLAER